MKKWAVYNIFIVLLITLVTLPFSGCITISSGQPSPSGSETTMSAAPVIESFTASPESIKSGEQAQLSWNVTGSTKVTLSPGIGFVDASGTADVNPTQTTTYTLTAENSSGSKTASITVNIIAEVARPDLEVTDVFLLADSLYFKVKNIGTEASKGNRAYLYINDVYTSDTYTTPINPGEEKTIVFNKYTWPYMMIEKEWSYSPTQQPIQYITKVCVDTENEVPEINESNNCYSIIMGSKLRYDLVENAHLAPWANHEGKLTFPTPAGNYMGSVFTEAGMVMEDGRSHSNILATYPQPVAGGYISGKFSVFYTDTDSRAQMSRPMVILPLSRFTAAVGFNKNASPQAKAKFTFSVVDDAGTSVYNSEIVASNDGKLDYFNIDLNSMTGEARSFVLRVDSLGEPGEDLAVWVDPLISE
jgi:hypothetical protein